MSFSIFKRKPFERIKSPLIGMRGEVRGTYASSQAVVAAPKGVKCKPGKRAPTKEESEWMDKIVRLGCIACILDAKPTRPTAVHHILSGGRRIGHLFSLGLCDPGHHQNGGPIGLVSRHPYKARFEAKYGTELELLEIVRRMV